MYGTLAGALAGRKVAFDRARYTATVDGRIAGVGKTISARHYANAVLLETWLSSHSMLVPEGATVPAA